MNPGPRPPRDLAERMFLHGWRMTQPTGDESVRWECLDGRWVSITLVDAGRAYVRASSGQEQMAPSFTDALALAERLRRLDA